MQRYLIVWNRGNQTKYQPQADRAKERSVILAERMRNHADKCKNCNQTDPDFYGIIALGL